MITISECAELSRHVYDIKSDLFSTKPERVLITADNYKDVVQTFHKYSLWTRVHDHQKPSQGCYTQLYIKFISGVAKHAVLAIRGTLFEWKHVENIIVDMYTWFHDAMADGVKQNIPYVYFFHVMRSLTECRRFIKTYFGAIPLTITGHSLGGALAKLVTLTARFPYQVVAFNAPGVSNLKGTGDELAALVIDVNARYGIINHIGGYFKKEQVLPIIVPNKELEAKTLFENFDENEYMHEQGKVQKAKTLYNDADNLITFSEVKEKVNQCVDEAVKNHRFVMWLEGDVAKKQYSIGCENKSILSEAKDVILAQHTIDNIIPALKLRKNKNIGSTVVLPTVV